MESEDGRVNRHSAPTANPEDTDTIRVNIIASREIVYGRNEVSKNTDIHKNFPLMNL